MSKPHEHLPALPPKCAKVYDLYMKGKTAGEISKKLEINRNTVNAQVLVARRKIEKMKITLKNLKRKHYTRKR